MNFHHQKMNNPNDHIRASIGFFWCQNCDTKETMNLPQPIKVVVKAGKIFTEKHKNQYKQDNRLLNNPEGQCH